MDFKIKHYHKPLLAMTVPKKKTASIVMGMASSHSRSTNSRYQLRKITRNDFELYFSDLYHLLSLNKRNDFIEMGKESKDTNFI